MLVQASLVSWGGQHAAPRSVAVVVFLCGLVTWSDFLPHCRKLLGGAVEVGVPQVGCPACGIGARTRGSLTASPP